MDVLEKQFYRIKDVSDFLDEAPSTLRFWEKEFPNIKPIRSSGGVRLYTARDIENFRIVKYLLRTKGMRLETARDQLKNNYKNVSTRVEALKQLKELRSDLKSLLTALSKRK